MTFLAKFLNYVGLKFLKYTKQKPIIIVLGIAISFFSFLNKIINNNYFSFRRTTLTVTYIIIIIKW